MAKYEATSSPCGAVVGLMVVLVVVGLGVVVGGFVRVVPKQETKVIDALFN